MIRSIAAPFDTELEDTFVPQRNFPRKELEEGVQRGDLLWIDLVEPNDEEIHWLEGLLNLHPAVVEDLMREDRRPTMMVYPKYLFLSLFQPQIKQHSVSGSEIHCVIAEKVFVTVRRSDNSVVDEVYNRVAMNTTSWKRGVAYFLYLTAQFVVDSYYPLLDRISERLNKLEDSILNDNKDKVSERTIYRVKQELISLRQMVAPQREVLASVIGEDRLADTQANRDLFRHLYERLLRIYDVIDSQRDLAGNLLDLLNNRESKRLGDAMNRLTIFSMIFLPLTFFTGFFELNFATTRDPITLPISGGMMLVSVVLLMIISSIMMYIFFRYRRLI